MTSCDLRDFLAATGAALNSRQLPRAPAGDQGVTGVMGGKELLGTKSDLGFEADYRPKIEPGRRRC